MPMLMTVLRRHLMVVGKSVVSLALLGLIVAQHDFSFLSAQRHRLNAITVMVCLGLLAIQITVVAGTRLKLVLETLGATLGLARTTQVALCGFFFEQVAFGFVGEIGRASCRERGEISVVAVSLKKKKNKGDARQRAR